MEWTSSTKKQGNAAKFTEVGDTVIGYYHGTVDCASKFGGMTKKHIINTSEGLKEIYHQAGLNIHNEFNPGDYLRIVFTGLKSTGKGNPMKLYDVKESVAKRNPNETLSSYVGDDSPEELDEETPLDEVKTAPAKPRVNGVAPDAAKKSRADILLSGTRNRS